MSPLNLQSQSVSSASCFTVQRCQCSHHFRSLFEEFTIMREVWYMNILLQFEVVFLPFFTSVVICVNIFNLALFPIYFKIYIFADSHFFPDSRSVPLVLKQWQRRVTRLCPHSSVEGNDTHDHWLWKTGYRVRRNRKCCTPPLHNISLTRMTAARCPHSVTPVAVFTFRNHCHSTFLMRLLSNLVISYKNNNNKPFGS